MEKFGCTQCPAPVWGESFHRNSGAAAAHAGRCPFSTTPESPEPSTVFFCPLPWPPPPIPHITGYTELSYQRPAQSLTPCPPILQCVPFLWGSSPRRAVTLLPNPAPLPLGASHSPSCPPEPGPDEAHAARSGDVPAAGVGGHMEAHLDHPLFGNLHGDPSHGSDHGLSISREPASPQAWGL